MLKLLAVGALAGVFANLIGDTATTIAAVAAGVAGTGFLAGRVWRLLREAADLVHDWQAVVKMLKVVPATLESLEARMVVLETTAAATREPVEAMARELDVSHRRSEAA